MSCQHGNNDFVHGDGCDLCAGSMASTHYRYLRDDNVVLGTICNVGNQILAKLRKRK